VVALDGTFPEENPACLVGREREWSFEGMSSNSVYEVDDTVDLSVVGHSLTTNNNQQTTVALRANDTNGEHVMLARLYPGGPILDSTKLDTFEVLSAELVDTEGQVELFKLAEDRWQLKVIVKPRSIKAGTMLKLKTSCPL